MSNKRVILLIWLAKPSTRYLPGCAQAMRAETSKPASRSKRTDDENKRLSLIARIGCVTSNSSDGR
jgi:hypothetical protein